jgi:hypothetical protein
VTTTGTTGAGPPKGELPCGTVGGRASSVPDPREPVQFEAEGAPVVTPTVAAVLARIVRTLRDRQKREAA